MEKLAMADENVGKARDPVPTSKQVETVDVHSRMHISNIIFGHLCSGVKNTATHVIRRASNPGHKHRRVSQQTSASDVDDADVDAASFEYVPTPTNTVDEQKDELRTHVRKSV
ncbi:hypothetical protein AAVH_25429 [Aphelenchoides avenae]|nr:hypothetical protein AAVH_25429 [Aphelenchus avenae]